MHLRLSSDLRGIFLDNHELGLEVFYNFAATNWLSVTPDAQVIAEPAFLTGVRLEMHF